MEQYNKDIDAALEEVANGNFYTHEEVVRLLNEDDGKDACIPNYLVIK